MMSVRARIERADVKIVAILAVTGVLIAIGILNFWARLDWPSVPYDGVIWSQTDGQIVAQSIEPGSPAERAGLRPGDVLTGISLDGGYNFDEVARVSDVQLYLNEAKVGSPISYLIERRNRLGQVSRWAADIDQLTSEPRKLWRHIYLGLVGWAYLIIGLYVLLRKRRTPHGVHFYAICLTAFVAYFYSFTRELNRLDWIVFYADSFALILLSPLFLHFCAVFPERRQVLQRHRWLIGVIYLPAALLLGLEILLATSASSLGEWAGRLRAGLDVAEHHVQFPAGFLGGGLLLLYSFLQAPTPILKQQLKWVVWGSVGIVPIAGFLVYQKVATTPVSPVVEVLAVIPLIFIPLSFGYSIVRYRLMDVDVIMRRSLVHLMAVAVVAGMFILLLLAAKDFVVGKAPAWVTTLIVGGALALAMLFAPLKHYIQVRIDRLFYGERYDARTGVRQLAQMLSTMTALEPLLQSISQRLRCMLSVDQLALFIREETAPTGFRLAHADGLQGEVRLPRELVERLQGSPPGYRIISLDEDEAWFMDRDAGVGSGVRGHESLMLNDQLGGLWYFVPCLARERLVAIIGLGRTSSGELLTSEDIELLTAIAPYVAVAIENSMLYQEQARRAEELAHLKEFSESIIESINVGILAVDPQGVITTCNSALEELLGIDRSRALQRKIDEVLDPELIRALRNVIGRPGWAVSDPGNIYKIRTTSNDGRELYLNVSIAPFETKGGETVGSLIVIEDITERLRLEQQLQQREKLSSIGLLAAGVAHEVNTPLTGISSYTQMLLKQLPPTDPRHKLLVKIHEQAQRASNIVTSLLNFSRMEATDFIALDIHKVIEDTLQLVEPQLRGRRVKVIRHYEEGLPTVLGNATKLQQVFMNLLLNARDAMPDGGRLTIRTFVDGFMVGIEIEDTGVGIPPEHIRRIYDPFFTTKGVGRGTGLGLALSYGIIQEHSGRIHVESRVGQGTQFTIYLPTAEVPASRPQPALRAVSGD